MGILKSLEIKGDVFTQPNILNKQAIAYILSFPVFLSLFYILINIVNQASPSAQNSFAATYQLFAPFIFALIIAAYLSKGKLGNFVIYGAIKDHKQIPKHYVYGIIASFILIFVFSVSVAGSIVPAEITLAGGSGLLAYIFVVGPIAVEQEEQIFASSLIPTIATDSRSTIVGSFFMFAIAVTFLYVQQIELTVVLLVFLALYISSRKLRRLLLTATVSFFYSAILVSFLFAIYHTGADIGNVNFTSVLFYLFVFRMIATIINWRLQSAIASRGMHMNNNLYSGLSTQVGGFTGNIPLYLFVLGLYVVGLWLPYRYANEKL